LGNQLTNIKLNFYITTTSHYMITLVGSAHS
jgi:hypothetical protein